MLTCRLLQKNLTGFFVDGMFTFEGAIFALFDTIGSVAFFFHRSVITTFALSALHDNQFTRHFQHPKVMLVFTDYPEPSKYGGPGPILLWDYFPQTYSMTSVTRPEATVRPPSRIAKRRPFSIAIGAISSTVMEVLSPGITISTPSERVMVPVTSVVRK